MNYCIETHELSKHYGHETVVNHLNLAVEEGALYGFLGPNGAGKTTTLKMILGLVHKSEGNILLFGKEQNEKNRLEQLRNVGSLIESPSYYGHLTAKENLQIVCTLKGLPESEIDRVLRIVHLDDVAKKRVSKFSLGMKQRLGIAAALIGTPRLLLLDEPTNGLDPAGIQEMRELIKRLPSEYGITVLVSSHMLSEIAQIADNVGIIRKGELVFQDKLQTLYDMSVGNMVIKTTNNMQAQALIPDSEMEEDQINFPILSDLTLAELSIRLVQNNIGIVRLEEHSRSLEDIFLDLTQKED